MQPYSPRHLENYEYCRLNKVPCDKKIIASTQPLNEAIARSASSKKIKKIMEKGEGITPTIDSLFIAFVRQVDIETIKLMYERRGSPYFRNDLMAAAILRHPSAAKIFKNPSESQNFPQMFFTNIAELTIIRSQASNKPRHEVFTEVLEEETERFGAENELMRERSSFTGWQKRMLAASYESYDAYQASPTFAIYNMSEHFFKRAKDYYTVSKSSLDTAKEMLELTESELKFSETTKDK